MNKIANLFEQLSKIIGGIVLYLLVAGFIDIVIRYYLFEIDITQYISASEIILSSFAKLLSTLKDVITLIFLGGIIDFIRSTFANKNRVKLFVPILLLELIIIAAYLIEQQGNITIVNCIFLFFKTFVSALFSVVLYNLAYNFWYILKDETNVEFIELLKRTFSKIIIAILITVIIFSLLNNFGFYLKSKYGRIKQNTTEFYLDNGKSILSNDTMIFIGKTNDYFFFWNKNSDGTEVYPAGEIKKVKVKNKRLFFGDIFE